MPPKASRNSPKHLKKRATTFRSSGPFYSDAFKCWRICFVETVVPRVTYEDEREAYISVERLEDANAIAPLVPAVKNFADFELLISTVRDKILRHSKTGGYCYAYSATRRGEALHRTEG